MSYFSEDAKYFAQIAEDGKLKVWETATNVLKQEFTPNLHLTTPCTCLHWIKTKVQVPWKKRKRQSTETPFSEESTYLIALGSVFGSIFVYSVNAAQIDLTINSNTSNRIHCLSWKEADLIYAGAEQFVFVFSVKEKTLKTKWKTGKDEITQLLIIPQLSRLLTAARNIVLWDVETHQKIKTFTGHKSDVTILEITSNSHFVSASKTDRILSCWSLNESSDEKNAVANLIMEDICLTVTLTIQTSNVANVVTTTRSGVLHFYQLTLNGKCIKPVKPKLTIQIAADSNEPKALITPIPILASFIYSDLSLMIAYGDNLIRTFEVIVPNISEKMQCLIRKDPRKVTQTQVKQNKKFMQPVIDNTVEYLTPFGTGSISNRAMKRKSSLSNNDVPMEERLENLTLQKSQPGLPKQDNLAQLLMQGLNSNDRTILQTVLCKRDENVIKNTVKRIPLHAIVPLLNELTNLIKGKTVLCHSGMLWLKYVVQIHAGHLSSNPQLVDMLSPILGGLENRLLLIKPVYRLRGRLDLLTVQINSATEKHSDGVEDALCVYKDKEDSNSDSDEFEINLQSESDNEWIEDEEDSKSQNEDDVIEENNVSNDEMSS